MKTQKTILKLAVLLLFAITVASGCKSNTATGSYQDINVYSKAVYGELGMRSFEYEGPGRNPLIIIHGLLGARLADSVDNRNIWGDFSLRDMLSGKNLRQLSHPMALNIPLNKLDSTVHPTGLLGKSEVHVMGLGFDYQGYDILVDMLEASGYVPDNKPLPQNKKYYSQFIFYYDWRRDISENAEKLKKFIDEKQEYIRKQYEIHYALKNHNVKFDIVAHSMGGLLARYFMRYGGTVLPDNEKEELPLTWEGANYVDRFIIIATPNAGYVDTLIELWQGLKLSPAAPTYPKTVIGTFPSYYQMLPSTEGRNILYKDTYTPVDYMNPEIWKKYKWGLADPGQDSWLKIILPDVATQEERQMIAEEHLEKCLRKARQFKKAMHVIASPPDNVELYLIAGDALETNHTLTVEPLTGILEVLRKDSGDGKITATSARLDLRDGGPWLPFMYSPIRWKAVYYLQGGHMGIMNSEVFSSNLRFMLLAAPTREQLRNALKYIKTAPQGK